MKTLGIVTEYNPFHKGHAYMIEEAKKKAGADRVVVVMSGSFVTARTAETTFPIMTGSVPKAIPPSFTLGQDTLISNASIPSDSGRASG